MDASLLARVLMLRQAFNYRDRWNRDKITAHQERALRRLRTATYTDSRFYRRHHAGLEEAPLNRLPPVTKADLMDHFDDAVTDPRLTLSALEQHLRQLVDTSADPGIPWQNRWWTAVTAGTTGRRGTFVWDKREWATVLASYARATAWAGIPAGPMHPLRTAVVSSRRPTHQSAVVGASLTSRMVPTLRLDATDRLDSMVQQLNAFAPGLLVGYPSALRPLATEQAAGRLHIFPQAIMSASEVLTSKAEQEFARAWHAPVFNVYAATETAGIASSCTAGRQHIYEDLVIAEPVDDDYAPVPPGTVGARLLVTVLFSRTLPIIRYELSDRISIAGSGCSCGRSFAVLTAVDGRAEDILHLSGLHAPVAVHPNVFHNVLDDVSGAGWQVIQREQALDILLAHPPADTNEPALQQRLEQALAGQGVQGIVVRISSVAALPRTPLGKAPLIRALRD